MKKPISFLSIFLSASLLFSGCALHPEATNGQSAAESISVQAPSTEDGSVSIEEKTLPPQKRKAQHLLQEITNLLRFPLRCLT